MADPRRSAQKQFLVRRGTVAAKTAGSNNNISRLQDLDRDAEVVVNRPGELT